MKYVVDIDGTICTLPMICEGETDYSLAKPIPHRIAEINRLFDVGHHITFFTARGMGRHNNDAVAVILEFFELTKGQLTLWGAKHHELIMGKPSGDVYIDDKAVNDKDFFHEKS